MCFYVLRYKYATPRKCLFGILDQFSEIKTTRVNLRNSARKVVTNSWLLVCNRGNAIVYTMMPFNRS